MKKVGITTTVPVEVVYAAGWIPVDVNNVFITSPDAGALVERAETSGYPRNVCAWTKGLYSTVLADETIRTVIGVTQGDCSNTQALMETLQIAGVNIVPFAFPFDRDSDLLRLQIEKLAEWFGTDIAAVSAVKDHLDTIRRLVHELDRLTWDENRVGGWINHLWQVSCSDFNGDPEGFARDVRSMLEEARDAPPRQEQVRLGYIGVPPIISNLYDFLEERGARVVFNETQRQFSMPFATQDIVAQYRLYTYPYGIFYRLQDIKREIKRRKIQGVLHYVQSFCYRQIEDLIVRRELSVPTLTLEADKPGAMDARTRVRLEAFLEMLQ